jgi:hypothetical protein
MSLKAFHIFFLAASVLLTIGFGTWELRQHRASGLASDLYLGIGSFVATIVIGVYGLWFLRKIRRLPAA